MHVNSQANRSRRAGSSDFAPGAVSPNQSLPNPESRGRRVAALFQGTNTMTLRTLAKGVGMSVATAVALLLTLGLFLPSASSAQLSCANGQPPVTGLSAASTIIRTHEVARTRA